MAITRLTIANVRNIREATLSLSPTLNFIYGENGSGKTSLLEAIHFLGLGRSFRTRYFQKVMNDASEKMGIYATLDEGIPLGIEKTRNGKTEIRFQAKPCISQAPLAACLPLQVINPDSHKVIEEGPKYRRQFLNWGVFHVEPQFLSHWQQYQKALKQRNTCLREMRPNLEVHSWDESLISHGEVIHQMRCLYMENFQSYFSTIIAHVLPEFNLSLQYEKGWEEQWSLAEALGHSFVRDRGSQSTQKGPHKAELSILLEDKRASDVLSRGQQKVLVMAMQIAQAAHLYDQYRKVCIFLIDDLAAELDAERRQRAWEQLMAIPAQLFITAVDTGVFKYVQEMGAAEQVAMFHVEQGVVERSLA